MHDDPPAVLLVAEARRALEAGLAPGFPQKVAANALGIAQRELELGPALEEAERERLVALLGYERETAALNRALAEGLRDGRIDPANEAVLAHLVATAIAKLSVDQPGYPGFRALEAASA